MVLHWVSNENRELMNEMHVCRSKVARINNVLYVLGHSIGWNWRVKIADFETRRTRMRLLFLHARGQ